MTESSPWDLKASFAGLGFYVGAQLGFKKAWYTILPAVFIPAYIGIELGVNALGFLGSEKDPAKAEITVDQAKQASVDFTGSVYDKFNGNIKFGSIKQYVDGTSQTVPQTVSLSSGGEGFRLREGNQGEPVWLPDGDISLQAGFAEAESTTLVENGYERPDSQLLTLSDGKVLLAYLENDPNKGAYERTTLKFAVYERGQWSDPVTVQNDGTADFQPSSCEADNGRVMIAWLSGEEPFTGDDTVAYLTKMEVYTAIINPDTMAVTELTRLTNDNYYDSMPSCAYDSESGDRMVFYVKSGKTTGMLKELTNPYTNDCSVMYMLYSEDDGRWLFDKYFDEELDPENHAEMIRDWKGQRFLSSAGSNAGFSGNMSRR